MKIFSFITTPNRLRRWLLVLLVGLITLASYWALEIIRSRTTESAQTVRTRPDYYVENFNFVKILPSGQSKYRVEGTKLEHYQSDDHADVTLPVIVNLDSSQPLVTVRSERGVIKNVSRRTESEIHLYDSVVIDQPKTKKSDHVQLKTNYLLTYPDKEMMETDLPVQIIVNGTVTTGIGMKANNATKHINILSQVHSIIPSRATSTPSKK